MRLAGVLSVAILCAAATAQKPELPKFMGRTVTLTVPPLDDDGLFPKGPASVCIEGPPEQQCYTATGDFGRPLEVRLIQIEKNSPALFFSVASGGVSGFAIHFTLLRPGAGKELSDLLRVDDVSNQSQYEFLNHPEISPSPIFVDATAVWGDDEAHYSPHRYLVSTYVLNHPLELGDVSYYLEDRYMTVRKYQLDAAPPTHILAAEKPEILARLRRVRAEETRDPGAKR